MRSPFISISIAFALFEYLVSFENVYVNAPNDEDMTPLDIASAAAKDNPDKTKYAFIEHKLKELGGESFMLGSESFKPKSNTTSDPTNELKHVSDRDFVNAHIFLASLIAILTFAAMFQIPGGIEDDKSNINYGVAKMTSRTLFRFFIFSDIMAFTASFTVVVVWLVGQLLGDIHFKRKSMLSHASSLTLIFSILWSVAAFLSATVIVTIPSNYKNNPNNEEYNLLFFGEISLVFLTPLYISLVVLLAIKTSIKSKYSKFFLWFPLCILTAIVIWHTVTRSF